MPTTGSSTTSDRLKREDSRRTKHDSAFSQWKLGKEGVERYRTQNLPNWISCPGVYELGIAASGPSYVVPVYIGQADNLRTRLQRYGRDGAHLENGCSTDKHTNCQSVSSNKGPGLFTDIFSRGLPIVYRCARMESKKDAEITEKQLLDKFDYAWNKGSKGARRPDDICKKLDRFEKASQFSLLAKKLLDFNQKQVGIKIKTCKPSSWQNESNLSDTNNNVNFSRIHGIRRFQPGQQQCGSGDSCTDKSDICGVVIGHGSVCTAPPLNAEGKIPPTAASMGSDIIHDRHNADFQDWRLSQPRTTEHPPMEKFAPICGFILDNGSPCRRKPDKRNKRCLEHKGRRIRVS
ncbi:hypothetical protein CDL12_12872 [Handroanthus impetiginosus]|uniref:GIY-YIG domain-containing protein n=1 Tax=Handroanthus impetiginosus TaxID=429701 RepID=A0A2G9HB27_9LAMI|nr:hypothetical protein CDL12_12872 [Handroanthus impetiginosus]